MTEHKGYYIKQNKVTPQHYIIVTTGRGGKIPLSLEGIFTSSKLAAEAIDRYLSTKAGKDGKTITESRDQ